MGRWEKLVEITRGGAVGVQALGLRLRGIGIWEARAVFRLAS